MAARSRDQKKRKVSQVHIMMRGMEGTYLARALDFLERSNSELSPEVMTSRDARELLAAYSKAQRLAAFGIAALTRRLDDAEAVAGLTGTCVGQAKATIETGRAIETAPTIGQILRRKIASNIILPTPTPP